MPNKHLPCRALFSRSVAVVQLLLAAVAAVGCGGDQGADSSGGAGLATTAASGDSSVSSGGATMALGGAGASTLSGAGASTLPGAGTSSGMGGTAGSVSAAGGGNGGASASGGAGGESGAANMLSRRVAYLRPRGGLTSWATKLDFSMVTHVVMAFAGVDAQGNVSYGDAGLSAFVSAAHSKGVKVCVALGGGGTNGGLGTLGPLISPAGRAAFIEKIKSYAAGKDLDCIDVDFEGPGVNQDYEGFVNALGPALRTDGRQLSAALASWYGAQVTLQALKAFDFVNVMAYDLHNPAGKTVPVQGSSLSDSQAEIDYWVKRGLDKSRAVLGVPFYGYRWTSSGGRGQAVAYSEVLNTYGDAAENDEIKVGGTTIYQNGPKTVAAKVALGKGYGGTMIWEIAQDASGDASLLRAMAEAD